MSEKPRPSWMTPIQYNDWFPDAEPVAKAEESVIDDPLPSRRDDDLVVQDEDDPEEGMGLMDEDEVGPMVDFQSTDTEPCDYDNTGDPDAVLGVDDEDEFDYSED